VTPGRASLSGVTLGEGLPVVVMGVLNLGPESFHPASVHTARRSVRNAARAMADAGAALLDLGGRSTAPYRSAEVDEPEECRRLVQALEWLHGAVDVPLSVDTTREAPARAALAAGVRVLNDVSGLRDPRLAALVAEHRASVILTATPEGGGAPEPARGPVARVRGLLGEAVARARRAGIPEERVVLDLGIGFFRAERVPWDEWDVRILADLASLRDLGRPLCVGVSRKSFLAALTGRQDPADRLAASLAATVVAVLGGAALIRTHDVAETVDAIRVAERVRRATMASMLSVRAAES